MTIYAGDAAKSGNESNTGAYKNCDWLRSLNTFCPLIRTRGQLMIYNLFTKANIIADIV